MTLLRISTWLAFYGCTVAAALTAVWFAGDLNANNWVEPPIAPPAWVFGPVWTTLYLLIATSAYRISQNTGHHLVPVALSLWALQISLNTLWTPVFFGAFDLLGAFYIILVLLAAIVAYTITAFKIDRVAGYLFLPYLAWVSFATILNYSYYLYNPV